MTITATEIAWREAGSADIEPLCAIVNQSYRPPVGWEGWLHQAEYFSGDYISSENLNTYLQRGTVIIAHRGKQLMGAVALSLNDDNAACIDWLAVPAPCQSLGLGRFLLYRAEILARAAMADALQLPVLRAQLEVVSCLFNRGFELQPQELPADQWPWAGEMMQPVQVQLLRKPLLTRSSFDVVPYY